MYDFVLTASTLVFCATLIAYLRHPAAALVHPASFYLLFHGFVFVIRPIVARWYDFDFVYRLYEFMPSKSDKITVILGTNLAMLVFVGVALGIAGRPVRQRDPEDYAAMRRALAWPIGLAAMLVTPIAVAAQLGNWRQRVNDFDTMMSVEATGISVNTSSVGWFVEAALMMAPTAVMVVWLARYRWWGWAYFGLFALLQAGSGGRGPLIYAVIAIGVVYLLERGQKWFDWRPVALALLAMVAFNQIVSDRGGAVREAFGGEGSSSRNTALENLDPLEHMDFANLEYFEYLVYAVPQRSGSWDYFANNLQIFTEPVPRVLWPDKPVGSPVQFYSLWDYGRPTGMTASLPGMGWVSLGYLGIIVQAAFFAAVFAWLYNWLLVRRSSPVTRLAYAICIGASLLIFRDGTVLTMLRLTPFYIAPLLIALALARLAGVGQRIELRPGASAPVTGLLGQTPAERRAALARQADPLR